MDTPILLFAIFGIILWLDYKRRNARIKEKWEQLGKKSKSVTLPFKSDIDTTMQHLIEYVEQNKVDEDTEVKNVISEEPDSIYDINKILTDMTEQINDAKKALKQLGYTKVKIEDSVTKVLSNTDTFLESEEIVKKSLNILNN